MMKLRNPLCCLLLFLIFIAPAQNAYTDSSGWETIDTGIEYQEFRLPGPRRVFVARMDRSVEDVILDTSIAQGTLAQGKETVSEMAERYDQAINNWGETWGNRNRVVVAINGSFHNSGTGFPYGGMIHSGWYAVPYTNWESVSGFVWKQDRSAFIGECVKHESTNQRITNLYNGESRRINGINRDPEKHELVIFTPQYDRDSHQNGSGVEVLVELTRPLGIVPPPDMILGIVREVREDDTPIPIPFDHIVVSGDGRSGIALIENFHVGDVVGLSLEITHLWEDCRRPHPQDWTNTYASIGGGFIFLKEGEIQYFDDAGANNLHPRTAICFNDDFIFFVVVDGRNDSYSIGMSITQLAKFCRDTLGATWGINQDGGGSSTMWVDGEVKNSPSDGWEREVANGVMMIVVEPRERSVAFWPGERVITQYTTNIHLGPGNYAPVSSVAINSEGIILPQINYINGVLAKGTYWWKVDFNGIVGWVDEDALASVNPDAPTLAINTWGINAVGY
jgi:hypothetical protein